MKWNEMKIDHEIQLLKDTKTKLQATNKDPTNERTKTTMDKNNGFL